MKIAALCSGGVDSSVSLGLLEEQDANVTAFYLRIWLEQDLHFLGDCPWKEDLNYIRELCKLTGVKLEVVDLQKDYHERVVQHAIDEVRAGRTPNPDIWCNTRIKFGLFADILDSGQYGDFDRIASGHYAQIAQVEGQDGITRPCLQMAPDPIKDQTYFLSHLKSEQLSRLMFPIGGYNKSQVRKIAQEMALPNATRKDSQGICFLGQFKYRDFIRHYCGTRKGSFIEHETGKRVGEHEGFWFYTIGQRKGLRIGGNAGGNGKPWYVVDKNPDENVVFVSQHYHEDHHQRDSFTVTDCNWFLPYSNAQLADASLMGRIQVKLRHGPDMQMCAIMRCEDPNRLEIQLLKNDQGIAAGQYAAFYMDDLCLGSGVIV